MQCILFKCQVQSKERLKTMTTQQRSLRTRPRRARPLLVRNNTMTLNEGSHIEVEIWKSDTDINRCNEYSAVYELAKAYQFWRGWYKIGSKRHFSIERPLLDPSLHNRRCMSQARRETITKRERRCVRLAWLIKRLLCRLLEPLKLNKSPGVYQIIYGILP